MEPRRMDGGVEQSQTLVHAILGEEMEIWYHTGSLSGDDGCDRKIHCRGECFKEMEVMRRSGGGGVGGLNSIDGDEALASEMETDCGGRARAMF